MSSNNTDGLFLYCQKPAIGKRKVKEKRLSVSVCIFRECDFLKEQGGEFFCKFKPWGLKIERDKT